MSNGFYQFCNEVKVFSVKIVYKKLMVNDPKQRQPDNTNSKPIYARSQN